jgi:hypothetical protein
MRALAALLQIVLILTAGLGRVLIEVLALFAGGSDTAKPKTAYERRATWERDGYSWEGRPDDLR